MQSSCFGTGKCSCCLSCRLSLSCLAARSHFGCLCRGIFRGFFGSTWRKHLYFGKGFGPWERNMGCDWFEIYSVGVAFCCLLGLYQIRAFQWSLCTVSPGNFPFSSRFQSAPRLSPCFQNPNRFYSDSLFFEHDPMRAWLFLGIFWRVQPSNRWQPAQLWTGPARALSRWMHACFSKDSFSASLETLSWWSWSARSRRQSSACPLDPRPVMFSFWCCCRRYGISKILWKQRTSAPPEESWVLFAAPRGWLGAWFAWRMATWS